MRYECRNCRLEEERGFLPSMTCGLYFLFLLGCVTGTAIPLLAFLRGDAAPRAGKWNWWHVLLIPLSVLLTSAIVVVGAILLDRLLSLIEYLAYCRRRCPRCGQRKWSWGYTSGYGL